MPTHSINDVDIVAVKDHVETYGEGLMEDVLLGFDSAQFLDLESGIKGTKILTEMAVVGNMMSNWREDYADNPDVFKFTPREISTHMGDMQFSIIPAKYENSYLGKYRKRGQKVEDVPFLSYCMAGALKKARTELNQAIWHGERDVTIKHDFTKLFDGFGTIIGKMKTAGTLVETTLGTPTADNIIEQVKSLWLSLHPAVRKEGLYLHLGTETALLFEEGWFDKYGKFTNTSREDSALFKQMKFKLAVHDALEGEEMMLCPMNNLVQAVDDEGDMGNLNVREKGKGYWYWSDYRIGAQIRHTESKYMAVNDKWAAK